MRENIYLIYDTKSQIGLKPFIISRNDVAPLREVGELVRNAETILHKHAADFQLIQVAVINLETLEIEVLERPRQVANAVDLVEKDE